MSAVPKGDLYKKVEDVVNKLRIAGVIVLPEGEMENYAPGTTGHGPAWVRAVIEGNSIDQVMRDRIAGYFLSATA